MSPEEREVKRATMSHIANSKTPLTPEEMFTSMFEEVLGDARKSLTDNDELVTLDMQLAMANKPESGPTSKVNQILRIAYGYERFITQCHDDVVNGYAEGLPVKDSAENPNGREFRSGKMLPFCENAFGDGLHESIQQCVFAYMPSVHPNDLAPIMRALTAYGSLAGRVSKLDNCDELMPRIERRAYLALIALSQLDPDMWKVGVEDEGKQWVNGMRAYILEKDGTSQVTGSVDKGASRRNHANGEAWTKETANSNCIHAYSIPKGKFPTVDEIVDAPIDSNAGWSQGLVDWDISYGLDD